MTSVVITQFDTMHNQQILYIKNFIFVFIPALISYLTNDARTFEVIASSMPWSNDLNSKLRFGLGLIAVMLQGCIGWRIIYLNLKNRLQFKYILNYLNLHKLVSLNEIGQAIKTEEKNILKQNPDIIRFKQKKIESIEVKIYLPQKNLARIFLEKITIGLFKAKILFFENPIKEFGQQHYTGLSFEVYPKPEGLVGRCYAEKAVCIQKNFSVNSPFLNLAPHQRDKMSDIKFYACCPVYLSRKSIKAILVFESRTPIFFEDALDPLFHQKMKEYRNQLEQEFPSIFKKMEGD